MARVPQMADAVALRPVEAPYQRINTTPDDFGMGAARAADMAAQRIDKFGDTMARRAIDLQLEDNENDARRMDVDLSKRLRTLGYGDGNEQNPGYFGLKGQAALDAFPDYRKLVEAAKAEVLGSARNQRSRDLFALKAEERVSVKMEGMTRHLMGERRTVADDLSKARINEALDDASANYNNPQLINQSLGVMRGEIESMAARNGWTPEVAASKLQESRSAIHKAVIKAALDRAPGYAQSYYARNKADIDGRDRPELERALETASIRGAAQAAEDRIMAMGVSEQQSLEEARKIRDPKLRDEAVQRVTARFGERDRLTQRENVGASQAEADRILGRSGITEREALAEASRITDPRLRDATSARVRQFFQDDNRVEDRDVRDQSQAQADRVLQAFPDNEQQALAEANRISDARIRDATVQRVRQAFQDRERTTTRDLVGASQIAADRITMIDGMTEARALAEAAKIEDPRVRDLVEQRLRARFNDRARVDQRDERDIRDRSWQVVVRGGRVDDIPASDLARMDGTTISAMRAFEERRSKDGRGYAKAVDPATDNRLHRLYMDDKVAFATYDMTQHYGQLTEERVSYWQALQRTVDARGEREAQKQTSYALGDRLARQYLDAAKIGYGEGTPKKQAEKSQRVFELVRGVADEFAAQGKRPTAADFDKALKELFLDGTIVGSGTLYDTRAPFFEVARTPQAAQFQLRDVEKQKQRISEVTGVPPDDVVRIAKALGAQKQPVTAANIRALYEAGRQR
jgi:hypothetical protein